MAPDDALRLATWVEGLFPEVTPQQVEFLAAKFEAFDYATAKAEVDRFRQRFETLTISSLLRRIGEEHQKRHRPSRPTADRDRVDQQWKAVDAELAQLSEAEIARRTRAVLDRNPTLAPFLKNRDPRTSPTLRSLLAKAGPA